MDVEKTVSEDSPEVEGDGFTPAVEGDPQAQASDGLVLVGENGPEAVIPEPEVEAELASAEDAQALAALTPGYGVPAADGHTYWA